MHEVLRQHRGITGTIPRYLNKNLDIEDKKGNKYIIPKGTFIMTNVMSINHDKKYWEDSYEMNNINFEYGNGMDEYKAQERADALNMLGLYKNNYLIFNPKRFLRKKKRLDGTEIYEFVGKGKMATFGIGKRDCAGQELGLKELYIVLGMLIRKYEFGVPDIFRDWRDFVNNIPKSFMGSKVPMIGVKVMPRVDSVDSVQQ